MKNSSSPALVCLLICAALPHLARADCTAFADAATGKILKQEGICDQRITPASTFKIAISLMGYDAGFLKDEKTPALPFRQGYPDWLPEWKQTTDPAAWMKYSVVWFSQQTTLAIGEEKFGRYVRSFGYGNADVSGTPGKHDGLTTAWLSSSLKISPLEQLAFLQKIVRRELPLSANAYDMTSRITAMNPLPNGWTLNGKTGTGAPLKPDGSEDWDHPYGWFIGWARKGNRTILFVRQVQEGRKQSGAGPRTRDAFPPRLAAALDSF